MNDRTNELERFAAVLMEFVRDPAISAADQLASGQSRAAGKAWTEILRDPAAKRAVLTVVPEIVDQVLFELLDAIDNDNLPLGWRAGDRLVALKDLGKGEMAGWFIGGEDGWRDRFSKQRFYNDFAGLTIDRQAPASIGEPDAPASMD